MILCVGLSGSGKSTLLAHLQSVPDDEKATPSLPTPIPTVGTNLVTLTRRLRGSGGGRDAPTEVCVVREVGGSMASLWHSYVEGHSQQIKGLLFTVKKSGYLHNHVTPNIFVQVDSTRPEGVGTATIHLLELLNRPGVTSLQVPK